MYVWTGKHVPLDVRRHVLKLAADQWQNGYDYSEFPVNPLCPLTRKFHFPFYSYIIHCSFCHNMSIPLTCTWPHLNCDVYWTYLYWTYLYWLNIPVLNSCCSQLRMREDSVCKTPRGRRGRCLAKLVKTWKRFRFVRNLSTGRTQLGSSGSNHRRMAKWDKDFFVLIETLFLNMILVEFFAIIK